MAKKNMLLVLMLLLCSNCRTMDRTLDEKTKEPLSDLCQIHGEKMKIRILDLHSGYPGYVADYYKKMKSEFPNYEDSRWGHTENMFGVTKTKAYICATCTRLYKRYWSENDSDLLNK